MSNRPNILIFNPDEMRGDVLAHLGNPASITPNLDRFAAEEAVSFSNAYCQNPVCVPSRCSFLTGLYPHTRGHRTMRYLLHPGEDTVLKELKEAGYYVWMNSRNDFAAGQIDGWMESHASETYYGGQKKHGPGPLNPAIRGEPGSKYYYSHFKGQLGVSEDGKNYNGDDEVVDAAIDRILHPVDDRPLCMFMGLSWPHVPYGVEEPYFSAIDRKKLPRRIRADECQGTPKLLALIKKYAAMDEFTEEDWDELRAVYLGMCMKVDEQFQRVVDALKQAGIYDNTAIFFFSDHGDFAGDYDLVEKSQNTFEDCLTRVPLLIKPPKGYDVDPGVSDSLTELIDFYATAMEFAGVTPNHTHFGKSLIPVLKDRSTPNREYVYSEGGRQPDEILCDEFHADGTSYPEIEYWPKKMAQTDHEAHAKGIMMRDHHYKYVSRTLGRDEFYDLDKNPEETVNLIDDPEYADRINKMQIGMLKWLQATDDIVPFTQDGRMTVGMARARVMPMVPDYLKDDVEQKIKAGANIGELMMYIRKKTRKE